nr:unnamed protein product [Haemonchus contortus]
MIIRFKAKVFKSAFYSIIVATAFADIASLFSVGALRLIRELNLGEETKYLALLSLIWTRRNVRIAIIIQYAISFVAFVHVTRGNVEYIRNDDGTVAMKGFREKQIDLIARFTTIGACIIYATVTLSLNVRLLFEWKRLSRADNVPKHGHHDKGLLLYTLLVFICSMLVCSQQIIKTVSTFTGNTSLNLWISLQYVWMNEIMVTLPSFSLLVLSSDFRQEIFNLFRCSKHRSDSSLFVTLPSARRSVVERF